MSQKSAEESIKKIHRIRFGFWAICLLIIMRLFYLQFEKNNECALLSQKNYTVTALLPALRGNFVDLYGYLLVSSRPVVDLYWQGSGRKLFSHEQERVIDLLSQEVSIERSLIIRAERTKKKILLVKDVALSLLSRLYEAASAGKFLHVEHRFKRLYPYGQLGCHLIGYINRFSFSGRAGLEQLYDQELQGIQGSATYIKNPFGAPSYKQSEESSVTGKTLQLTIDLLLQARAEQLFSPGQSGALLVMDPEDGALRVALSYPGFDPNKFLDYLPQDQWQKIVAQDNPLLNRFSHAAYPPGSLFKLVTLAAGYQDGLINDDTTVTCTGSLEFCGRKYYCMRRWGHGKLSVKQAIASSCNILCYEIGRTLFIDRLALYGSYFGLGKRTGFSLGDVPGLMPTVAWKKEYKKEGWWQGETISASIGQSFVMITPLQAARMIASIYKGYLVKPRILVDEAIEKEPLYVEKNCLKLLRDSMKEAVQSGTVKILQTLKEFTIYAKTGTAQTCSLDRGQGIRSREQREHAWFSAWFCYKNHKPLVLVVLLEHAGSSRYALTMAKNFFEQYQKLAEYREARGVKTIQRN